MRSSFWVAAVSHETGTFNVEDAIIGAAAGGGDAGSDGSGGGSRTSADADGIVTQVRSSASSSASGVANTFAAVAADTSGSQTTLLVSQSGLPCKCRRCAETGLD